MSDSGELNILIETGADFVLPYTIYDNNGDPVDLTDSVITSHVRRYAESAEYFEFICSHSGAGGRVVIMLPNEVTSKIAYPQGVYDVKVVLADGFTTYVLKGNVKVRHGVTKQIAGTMLYTLGFDTLEDLPEQGQTQRLYFVYDQQTIYRWTGTNFVSVSKMVLNPVGEWDEDRDYYQLDFVSRNGSTFVAKRDVPVGTPVSDTDYWMQVSYSLGIGEVTTVAAEEGAAATITGYPTEPKLNLQIPRGVAGNESINDEAGIGDHDYVWSADRLGKASYYVTPEMFGAKGDGTTDDSEAFQDACDNGKVVVLFKDKTYRIHDISISNDITIIGNGATIKAVPYDNTNEYRNIFSSAEVKAVIRDVVFEGVGAASGTAPVRLTHALKFTECGLVLDECKFKNFFTSRHNEGTDLFADRFGLILTAIDCPSVIMERCEVCNIGGDEMIWVCPNEHDFETDSFVMRDCNWHDLYGYSINVFSGEIDVENNIFKDFSCYCSVFNFAGRVLNFNRNILSNLDCSNVLDTYENGWIRIEDKANIIGNTVADANEEVFIVSAKNALIKNNLIDNTVRTAVRTVFGNNTTITNDPRPEVMQYQAELSPENFIITDNTINVNESSTGHVIACNVMEYNQEVRCNYTEISGNTINYLLTSQDVRKSTPFASLSSVRNLNITKNTIRNIPYNDDISLTSAITGLCKVYVRFNTCMDCMIFTDNIAAGMYDNTNLYAAIYALTDLTISKIIDKIIYKNNNFHKITNGDRVYYGQQSGTTNVIKNYYTAAWQSKSLVQGDSDYNANLTENLVLDSGTYLVVAKTPYSSSSGEILIGVEGASGPFFHNALWTASSYGLYTTVITIDDATAKTVNLHSLASSNSARWDASSLSRGGMIAIRI